jgi:hypothetical protein
MIKSGQGSCTVPLPLGRGHDHDLAWTCLKAEFGRADGLPCGPCGVAERYRVLDNSEHLHRPPGHHRPGPAPHDPEQTTTLVLIDPPHVPRSATPNSLTRARRPGTAPARRVANYKAAALSKVPGEEPQRSVRLERRRSLWLAGLACSVFSAEAKASNRQLSEGESCRGDVVGGGVRARIARPEQSGDGFTGAARPVVDEPHQGVVAVGLLPGRGGVLLVRVGDDQNSVQVHGHLAAGVRIPVGGHSQTRSRISDRALRMAVSAFSPAVARVPIRRETVGSEATGPNTVGSARSVAMSARQSPPSATASAMSRRTLPGSWTARGFRHGASLRITPGRDRSCGPFRRAGRIRPGRRPDGRHPGHAHEDRSL